MGALEWARPGFVWTLILPLILLAWFRFSQRSPTAVTGTLELWKEVAHGSPQSARVTRRGTPPWVWFCATALLFGALGLIGPRLGQATPARRFTVIVDPSPSMGLAHLERAGYPSGKEATRRARALEMAGEWLVRTTRDRDRVRWILVGAEPIEVAPGETPAELRRSLAFASTPEWKLFDQPGTLLVTDHMPTCTLEFAGYAVSGGRAVFGAIAVEGHERVDWEGAGWRSVPGAAPARAVVIESSAGEIPEVLQRVVSVWAQVRGIELNPRTEIEEVLRLSFEGQAGDDEFEVQRDGWRARVRGGPLEASARADETIWLTGGGEGGALVRAAPGTIRLGLAAMEEPRGDPARFALSFAKLFDRWCLSPAGVVPLEEREDAGPAAFKDPAPAPLYAPLQARDGLPTAEDLDAWLAGLAGVLALFALSLRRA